MAVPGEHKTVQARILEYSEAIGFSDGVTWNRVRRNIFNWKHEDVGKLEAKVKSFCAIPLEPAI